MVQGARTGQQQQSRRLRRGGDGASGGRKERRKEATEEGTRLNRLFLAGACRSGGVRAERRGKEERGRGLRLHLNQEGRSQASQAKAKQRKRTKPSEEGRRTFSFHHTSSRHATGCTLLTRAHPCWGHNTQHTNTCGRNDPSFANLDMDDAPSRSPPKPCPSPPHSLVVNQRGKRETIVQTTHHPMQSMDTCRSSFPDSRRNDTLHISALLILVDLYTFFLLRCPFCHLVSHHFC